MNTFDTGSGWMFVALAALFSLGLASPFAHRFYPTSTGFLRRLAAPLIFALIALVCFQGMALQALSLVVGLGVVLIAVSRRNGRTPPPPA